MRVVVYGCSCAIVIYGSGHVRLDNRIIVLVRGGFGKYEVIDIECPSLEVAIGIYIYVYIT